MRALITYEKFEGYSETIVSGWGSATKTVEENELAVEFFRNLEELKASIKNHDYFSFFQSKMRAWLENPSERKVNIDPEYVDRLYRSLSDAAPRSVC